MADLFAEQPGSLDNVLTVTESYRLAQLKRIAATGYCALVATVGQLIIKPAHMENLGDCMTAAGIATALVMSGSVLLEWEKQA
ncbi:MAG: hypothetical protein ABIQ89_02150 [Candidatus Saccharimonadales bacterium]